MKTIQKVIYAGFAAVALVSASMPIFGMASPLRIDPCVHLVDSARR